jgi:hypothetical protein
VDPKAVEARRRDPDPRGVMNEDIDDHADGVDSRHRWLLPVT